MAPGRVVDDSRHVVGDHKAVETDVFEHLHDRVYPFKPAPSEDERQSASRDHVGNKWKTTSVDPRIIDVMPLKDELWIEHVDTLLHRLAHSLASKPTFNCL